MSFAPAVADPPPAGDGTPPADGGTPPASTFDIESPETYSNFVQALPEELRSHQMFQETKSLKALADQAINAQRALGSKRLEAPSDSWDDQKWEEFYNNIRPATADDYAIDEKFTFGEGDQAKEFSLDEASVKELKELAHKNGFSQKQAGVLARKLAELQVTSTEQMNAQVQEAIQSSLGALKAEWGDNFSVQVKAATETFEAFAEEIPELKQLMDWSPFVANHPALIKLFAKLSSLAQESTPSFKGVGGQMGGDTIASIQHNIKQLETEHADLLLHKNPAELPMADRKRRERLLEERAALYEKLYAQG